MSGARPSEIDPRVVDSTRPRSPRSGSSPQDRVQVGIDEIATWDRYLLRETRLLVPIDVQALYVPRAAESSKEPMVRLPMQLATPEGADAGRRDARRRSTQGTPRPRRRTPALGDARRAAARPARHREPTAAATGSGCRRCPTAGWCCGCCTPATPTSRRSPAGCSRPTVRPPCRSPSGPRAVGGQGGHGGRRRADPDRAHRHRRRLGRVGRRLRRGAEPVRVPRPARRRSPALERRRRPARPTWWPGWWSRPARDPLDSARSNDSLDELLESAALASGARLGRRSAPSRSTRRRRRPCARRSA